MCWGVSFWTTKHSTSSKCFFVDASPIFALSIMAHSLGLSNILFRMFSFSWMLQPSLHYILWRTRLGFPISSSLSRCGDPFCLFNFDDSKDRRKLSWSTADMEVLTQPLVFGLTANNSWCRSSDLALVVVDPCSWARWSLHPIYGSRLLILEDTGRLDSQGEHRLCYRNVRTMTLDVSIVATSRGPCGPDGPRALDGSTSYVYRSRLAVAFTCLCSVIWEFISHTVVLSFNIIY
jgi:hypothetical protein